MPLSMRVFGVNLDPNMFLNRVFFVVVGVLQFGHTHTAVLAFQVRQGSEDQSFLRPASQLRLDVSLLSVLSLSFKSFQQISGPQ